MREIVQDGTPILRAVARPVPDTLFASGELTPLIANMAALLDQEKDGVALAAPQVNSPYRIFIVRKDRTVVSTKKTGATPEPIHAPEVDVYINPEIIRTSRKRIHADEGCLSVRGTYGTTNRHERVTIRAQRLNGSKFERNASGLMAQIFEHEMDHLKGILFIDHATKLIHVPRGSAHPFAYFGSPHVSEATLEFLITQGYVPTVVVTSPDAPKGRGLNLSPTETRILAEKHGIPVLTPDTLNTEVITEIKTFGCEYALVVAYGKIFPEALINSFPMGVLNVHYSLLPRYRGAAPLEAAILGGDTETGVTIQKLVRELDAGDILAQQALPIQPDDTAATLRPQLIELGAQLLVKTLPDYLTGNATAIPQDTTRITYAPKRKKEDGHLDLSDSPLLNWNKYRAYADTIGTYYMDNGKRIKIIKASLINEKFKIERVIPEGRREMAFSDFKKS